MGYVCYRVLEAIGTLGSAAAPALPHLERLLHDTDSDLRVWALEAMEKLGDVALTAEPLVQQLLADEDADVSNASYHLLGRLGALRVVSDKASPVGVGAM